MRRLVQKTAGHWGMSSAGEASPCFSLTNRKWQPLVNQPKKLRTTLREVVLHTNFSQMFFTLPILFFLLPDCLMFLWLESAGSAFTVCMCFDCIQQRSRGVVKWTCGKALHCHTWHTAEHSPDTDAQLFTSVLPQIPFQITS